MRATRSRAVETRWARRAAAPISPNTSTLTSAGSSEGDPVTFQQWSTAHPVIVYIYIYLHDAVSGTALGNSDMTVTLNGTAKIVGVSRTILAGTMRIENLDIPQ